MQEKCGGPEDCGQPDSGQGFKQDLANWVSGELHFGSYSATNLPCASVNKPLYHSETQFPHL